MRLRADRFELIRADNQEDRVWAGERSMSRRHWAISRLDRNQPTLDHAERIDLPAESGRPHENEQSHSCPVRQAGCASLVFGDHRIALLNQFSSLDELLNPHIQSGGDFGAGAAIAELASSFANEVGSGSAEGGLSDDQ